MRKRIIVFGVLMLGSVLIAPQLEAQTPTPRPAPTARRESPRGWIGIMFQRGDANGLLVVSQVYRDSPAQRAGIQEGDTIVLWNGRRDVAEAMAGRQVEPGDTIRVRLRRGGQRDQDLAIVATPRPVLGSVRSPDGDVIVLGPLPNGREVRVFADSLRVRADSLHQRLELLLRDSLGPRLREFERMVPEFRGIPEIDVRFPDGDAFVFDLGRRSVAGAEFTEVNEGLGSYFGTDGGVLVLTVAPETPAARAGLQPGDVVTQIDGQAVETVAAVRRAVTRARARDIRRVELTVVRKGQRRELEMRWE